MTCVHVLGRRHQGSIHLSRVLLGKLPVWKEIRKALGGGCQRVLITGRSDLKQSERRLGRGISDGLELSGRFNGAPGENLSQHRSPPPPPRNGCVLVFPSHFITDGAQPVGGGTSYRCCCDGCECRSTLSVPPTAGSQQGHQGLGFSWRQSRGMGVVAGAGWGHGC